MSRSPPPPRCCSSFSSSSFYSPASALPPSSVFSPGASPELRAISRDASGRKEGCFAPILLPKCADIDVDVNSSTQQHTLATSSSSSPSTSSSSFASSISYKRGPSPLVSRLLKRLRAPASSSRVPVRVLTALSFTDADALLAARVEKAEITETELISLLHPHTRDALHIVGCAHIRNATLRRCIETCAPNLVSIDFSHSTQVNNSVVSRVLMHPHLQTLVL